MGAIRPKVYECVIGSASVDFKIHEPVPVEGSDESLRSIRGSKISIMPSIGSNRYMNDGFVFQKSKPEVVRDVARCLLAIADWVDGEEI